MTRAPFVLMVAGPNGSGKTTLTNQLRLSDVDFGRYINPDDIAKSLKGDYESRVREAQRIADQQRADCINEGMSFSFETVMSHPSKVDLLKVAKTRGFRVALYFVATESPDLNVRRVRQRVALGGHDVPEERIRERYDRTLQLLPDAMACADQVVLFDNSYGRPAIIRPFFRTMGLDFWREEDPIPDWARPALQTWHTQRARRLDERSNGEN